MKGRTPPRAGPKMDSVSLSRMQRQRCHALQTQKPESVGPAFCSGPLFRFVPSLKGSCARLCDVPRSLFERQNWSSTDLSSPRLRHFFSEDVVSIRAKCGEPAGEKHDVQPGC